MENFMKQLQFVICAFVLCCLHKLIVYFLSPFSSFLFVCLPICFFSVWLLFCCQSFLFISRDKLFIYLSNLSQFIPCVQEVPSHHNLPEHFSTDYCSILSIFHSTFLTRSTISFLQGLPSPPRPSTSNLFLPPKVNRIHVKFKK